MKMLWSVKKWLQYKVKCNPSLMRFTPYTPGTLILYSWSKGEQVWLSQDEILGGPGYVFFGGGEGAFSKVMSFVLENLMPFGE